MTEQLRAEEFDRVYGILEKSFPETERRSYEGQKKLLQDPRYRIYVRKEGKEILAFLALWDLGDWMFAEHLAVSPDHRNGGLGGRFLREMMERAGGRMCLEVELPDTETAKRRIGFYERNGFFLNRYPYEQPPLSKGADRIPMYVMTAGRPVGEEEFESLRRLVYASVYRNGEW